MDHPQTHYDVPTQACRSVDDPPANLYPVVQFAARRRFLQQGTVGLLGAMTTPWCASLATAATIARQQSRHCVLLWMAGGPSQLDTFDMKPGHSNGGSLKESATSVPGIRFSEHLPKLAAQAGSLAIMRGMSTKEGDHERGTTLMRTGHAPGGPVQYPSIGSSLAKALGHEAAALPQYVSVAPGPFITGSISPGFLGPKFASTVVAAAGPVSSEPANGDGFAQLRVDFLDRVASVGDMRHQRRLRLWRTMQREFLSSRHPSNVVAHDTTYDAAIRMIESGAKKAFDLSGEPDSVREAYGRGEFGQGCLMARRLIEHGVPFVEVTLGDNAGWDTHADNFSQVRRLSAELDAGWATLMSELRERDLLDRTTILWAGEFGRTPAINPMGGRDHFPQAFTCVLAGGGIAGGQVYGETSKDGMEVTDGKIDQQDLLATLCEALSVDPATQNIAAGGRPVAIAEGTPVSKLLS